METILHSETGQPSTTQHGVTLQNDGIFMFNPLKTKRICVIHGQSVPRSKHSPPRI